ncbi:conserved hypothetical protein [Culex quinquefasciatus]|uniref:DUF4218 domain-containing protein n=1 Tax=Culex quinquefasciatus TaxID=7176 RepID=B0X7C7_CULQU|nr:conserved hypothetical protein [Culex quinquefasciatus]|eukprot:XP_001865549.1 conserved hypothetical protein [Culex quinquefasciatus]
MAQNLLDTFVVQFPEHYGANASTHNVHMLLHLPHYVKLYGNFPSISAFRFENFKQQIKANNCRQEWNRGNDGKVQGKNKYVRLWFAYRTCRFDNNVDISEKRLYYIYIYIYIQQFPTKTA